MTEQDLTSDPKDKNLKQVAYYPGCALEGTGHAYNRSTKAVGKALGLELVEVKDWNCCGAMEVKNIDPQVQTYLSARNLTKTEEMGFDVVMAPCNGCYHNLKKAEYDLAHNPQAVEANERISAKAGHPAYQPGRVETIHALDWLKRAVGEKELARRTAGKLKGMKIANYYGCMYTRPRHIFPDKDQGAGSESTHAPHFMDDLLASAGAENVDFPLKTACCGGAHAMSDADTSTQLVLNILTTAEACGAEVIATECPTCHTSLEIHQLRAEKLLGRKTNVKILYFTQLLGMALGLSQRKVGVAENMADPRVYLKERGLR
ncbi:disulfide reductase [Rhodobacter sp. TJ_12]|nr:disulfide reductase [Rhodobacter sp. TJ_12]